MCFARAFKQGIENCTNRGARLASPPLSPRRNDNLQHCNPSLVYPDFKKRTWIFKLKKKKVLLLQPELAISFDSILKLALLALCLFFWQIINISNDKRIRDKFQLMNFCCCLKLNKPASYVEKLGIISPHYDFSSLTQFHPSLDNTTPSFSERASQDSVLWTWWAQR